MFGCTSCECVGLATSLTLDTNRRANFHNITGAQFREASSSTIRQAVTASLSLIPLHSNRTKLNSFWPRAARRICLFPLSGQTRRFISHSDVGTPGGFGSTWSQVFQAKHAPSVANTLTHTYTHKCRHTRAGARIRGDGTRRKTRFVNSKLRQRWQTCE